MLYKFDGILRIYLKEERKVAEIGSNLSNIRMI